LSGDFVFGGRNLISSRTVIQLQTAGEAAFEASNPAGGIGLLGTSGINDVSNPMNIEAGLWAAGKNGAFGGWVQSEGKPGLLAISDQIGSLAIQGMYSDAPQSDFLKAAAWNYSKDHFGTWSQSLNGVGSLSVSDASVGALNISGMYGDLPPEMAFIKAGSWNYSKFYVGGWNASEESFGSLSLSMSESKLTYAPAYDWTTPSTVCMFTFIARRWNSTLYGKPRASGVWCTLAMIGDSRTSRSFSARTGVEGSVGIA